MGIPQLPDELAMTLTESLPCREEQLRLFQALLSVRASCQITNKHHH